MQFFNMQRISANAVIIGFFTIFSPSDNSPRRKHICRHQIKRKAVLTITVAQTYSNFQSFQKLFYLAQIAAFLSPLGDFSWFTVHFLTRN